MRGLFITFEGNDGSGKSSALETIKQKLIDLGYNVIYTREPGGSYIAEKIRHVILDKDNLGMDDRTEALLYAASRREHITKTVLPALNEGKIILCDRFLDSSLAYQGFARGLGIEEVYKMNQFATCGIMPDVTILVCVHPEIGLARINRDARDLDRLELEKMDFHNKVYEGYLEVGKMFPDRIKMINGEKTREEVVEDAWKIIEPLVRNMK